MQSHKPTKTVIFVSPRKPEVVLEQEMEALGVNVQWASSIVATAALLNASIEDAVVITELALADGNWSDLVERTRALGGFIPIVLVTSARTAELWWDALERGVEDILVAPLSAYRLYQLFENQAGGI